MLWRKHVNPTFLFINFVHIIPNIYLISLVAEKTLDFMNLDDQSLGMLWVLSFTMAQPVMDAVVNWLKSAGVSELAVTQNVQSNERIMIMNETCPLPMKLLSGLSINLCWKLYLNLEEIIFFGQVYYSLMHDHMSYPSVDSSIKFVFLGFK